MVVIDTVDMYLGRKIFLHDLGGKKGWNEIRAEVGWGSWVLLLTYLGKVGKYVGIKEDSV